MEAFFKLLWYCAFWCFATFHCFGFDMFGFCAHLFGFCVVVHVPQFERMYFLRRTYGWCWLFLVLLIVMKITLPRQQLILRLIVPCFGDTTHNFVDFFDGTAPNKMCTCRCSSYLSKFCLFKMPKSSWDVLIKNYAFSNTWLGNVAIFFLQRHKLSLTRKTAGCEL